VLSLVAVGQTIVILTAGIDLSVGGVMSFGNALLATHMHSGSVVPWVLAVLAIGGLLGATNGLIIATLRMQPFIVTLATWSILDGAALLVLPSAGGTVPSGFSLFIYDHILGIPSPLFLIAALAVLWLWLKRTRAIRRVYALGSDAEAAYLSGVPIRRTKILAYSLCGLFAMGAGVIYTMQTSSGDPTSGDPFILQSVAAVVIGGTALSGGRGGGGGSIVGALVLTLIADVLFALRVSPFWTPIVQGALMIAAVLIGVLGSRRTVRLEDGV
jgi:ribose transport system permease protein